MPKDDWAKYARRDKGRKALRTGEYFRTEGKQQKKQKPKKSRKKKQRVSNDCEFVIEYSGPTPETSTFRVIKSGPLHKGVPPWPGFT